MEEENEEKMDETSKKPTWVNPNITSISAVLREIPFAASNESPFTKLAYVVHGHLRFPDSVTHTHCITMDTGCGPNLFLIRSRTT